MTCTIVLVFKITDFEISIYALIYETILTYFDLGKGTLALSINSLYCILTTQCI